MFCVSLLATLLLNFLLSSKVRIFSFIRILFIHFDCSAGPFFFGPFFSVTSICFALPVFVSFFSPISYILLFLRFTSNDIIWTLQEFEGSFVSYRLIIHIIGWISHLLNRIWLKFSCSAHTHIYTQAQALTLPLPSLKSSRLTGTRVFLLVCFFCISLVYTHTRKHLLHLCLRRRLCGVVTRLEMNLSFASDATPSIATAAFCMIESSSSSQASNRNWNMNPRSQWGHNHLLK